MIELLVSTYVGRSVGRPAGRQFVTRPPCLKIAVRHTACLFVSVQVLEAGADTPLFLVNVHAYTLRCM